MPESIIFGDCERSPYSPRAFGRHSRRTHFAVTLPDFLNELTDPAKPMTYSGLLQLTDLSEEGTSEFMAVWPELSMGRRREIVRKLIELADDNVEFDFTSVFRTCLTDEEAVIREMAARGLWETEDRAVIRPLVVLLESDTRAEVRASAALSLKHFAVMAQNGKLITRDGERIRGALLSAVNSATEDIDVRRRAIEAVASFDTPETNDVLRSAYESDNPALVQSAIYGMGQSSNSEWLPTVIDEMSNPVAAIRYEAATACGLLGDQGVAPRLARLLGEEDSEVRLASVKALGLIGGATAKSVLQECLSDEDEAIEEAAREALTVLEFEDNPLGYSF